jgi:hypothetical protein
MRKIQWLAAPVLAVLLAGGGTARAETLITEAEAKLPAAEGLSLRGVTRGPGIKMISPASIRSPFHLQVKFEPRGGARIEPGSIKVVYVKSPAVDITGRVKPFVSGDGIDMAKAEVPPGQHVLRIEVKDSEGRAGTASLELTVAP